MRGRGYGGKGTGVRPKDIGFYVYPMESGKVNPNNDDLTLHKGSLKSPSSIGPNKGAIEIQTL